MAKYLMEYKHLDESSDYPSVEVDELTFESLENIAKFIVYKKYDTNFKVLTINRLVDINGIEKNDIANFITKENQRMEEAKKAEEKKKRDREKNLKRQTEDLQYKLYQELKAKFEPATITKT